MNTGHVEIVLKTLARLVGLASGAGVVIALIALIAEYEDSVGWAVPTLIVCVYGLVAAMLWAALWAIVHLLRKIYQDI